MSVLLRVLLVEDSEDDALLLIRELRRGGFDTEYIRVDTPEALSAALEEQKWDIVISDYVMPRFSGLAALELVREKAPELSFIMVSGKMGEETAVDAMKAGAHDYVTKQNLSRLIPAVARELREAEERRQRLEAERELHESEERYRDLVDLSPDAIVVYSEGQVVFVNRAGLTLIGANSIEEVNTRSFLEAIHPEDRKLIEQRMRVLLEERKSVPPVEVRLVRLDDSIAYVEAAATPIMYRGKPAWQAVVRDITERKMEERRKEEIEEHKRDFYRRTILAATEGKLLISEPDEIDSIAGPSVASWQVTQAQDVGIVRRAIAEHAKSAGMDKDRVEDFVICVGEAATNAWKHAGGGTVSLNALPDALLAKVTDSGPGIEALALPELALTRGYSTARSLGVGYKAIISLADQVYLSTGPSGTIVAIEMKMQPLEEDLGADQLPETWSEMMPNQEW